MLIENPTPDMRLRSVQIAVFDKNSPKLPIIAGVIKEFYKENDAEGYYCAQHGEIPEGFVLTVVLKRKATLQDEAEILRRLKEKGIIFNVGSTPTAERIACPCSTK